MLTLAFLPSSFLCNDAANAAKSLTGNHQMLDAVQWGQDQLSGVGEVKVHG
jgi:hypothetical protein